MKTVTISIPAAIQVTLEVSPGVDDTTAQSALRAVIAQVTKGTGEVVPTVMLRAEAPSGRPSPDVRIVSIDECVITN